ncbi:MAG TPA: hypothetical protein VII48_06925, partial [Rhizomicrobium sp.]
MAEWQEKDGRRIGNTAEPFDKPVGHFSRSPKGRGSFGLWQRRSSLMGHLSPLRSSLLAREPKSPASRPRDNRT